MVSGVRLLLRNAFPPARAFKRHQTIVAEARLVRLKASENSASSRFHPRAYSSDVASGGDSLTVRSAVRGGNHARQKGRGHNQSHHESSSGGYVSPNSLKAHRAKSWRQWVVGRALSEWLCDEPLASSRVPFYAPIHAMERRVRGAADNLYAPIE